MEKEVEYKPDIDLGISNDTDNISDTSLKAIRIKTIDWIAIAYLNINSSRNKFELLANEGKGNVDFLVISKIGRN